MATSRTDSLYLFAAHVNTSSACACVCACVRVGVYALLNLFLETAAAGSIIYSAGIDIPRMLSSISDPSGENIAVPKRPMHARRHARMHAHACEEVAFHRIYPKGGNAFSRDGFCSNAELRGTLIPVTLGHNN